MGTTMKAFVMQDIGRVGFMEKPIPNEVGPNGAIIKTTRALVCTSDVHTVKGAIGNRKNLTLGHETGVVRLALFESGYARTPAGRNRSIDRGLPRQLSSGLQSYRGHRQRSESGAADETIR